MNTRHRNHLLLGTAAVVLLAGGVLYGCQDFLTDAALPQGTLDQGTLANKNGVEGSLIATYRALEWNNGVGGAWGSAASNWVWGSVPGDEAYKGSEASDQPPINDIEGYHWGTADAESYLNDKWRAVYEGIVRANATLRLLAQIVEEKPGELTAAEQSSIRGEALFLRAHFHFEGWRMWANIPYYKEDDGDFRKANATSAEVIQNILGDLDEAIGLLPTAPRGGATGRVTQWTAKAYKGRVQVYNKDYAGAVTTLTDVRNSGPYDLEQSFDRVWTGMPEYANGPETILAYQASANDGEPNGNNANYGERLNFPHSGSRFGCCGFHQPSQNLVNFYRVDAAGLPLILTDATWNASDATFVGGSAVAVDPRLDWTVGRDDVPFKDWGLHKPGWIRAVGYGGPYSAKKNVHESASGAEQKTGWVPSQLNSVNIHIFRYADMLLLLAEAMVETNDLAGARTIVNEIRARAGVAAQGCGLPTDPTLAKDRDSLLAKYPQCANDTRWAVPLNDPSITWAVYRVGQYTLPFASQAAARAAVEYERKAELAMEGQRFFDLKRLGTAEAVLNAYLAVERNRRPYLVGAEAFGSKHLLYPIPAVQVELSRVEGTPRLTQNTGW